MFACLLLLGFLSHCKKFLRAPIKRVNSSFSCTGKIPALEHSGSNSSEHSIVQVQTSDSSHPTIIYLLYCTDPAYPSLYVGMTTKNISIRLNCHRFNSKKGNSPLYTYMRESGGGTKWIISSLQVLYSPTESEARDAEQRWIDYYSPALNSQKSGGSNKNTIFYKLSCDDISYPLTYIGRTTRDIAERMSVHKSDSKKGSTRLYKYIRESGGWHKWSFEILEEVVGFSFIAANECEKKWIELKGSELNDCCPGGMGKEEIKKNRAEYREKNRAAILAQKAVYYEKNGPAILAKKAIYREMNRHTIRAKSNERYAENRDTINARRRERYADPAVNAKAKEYYSNNKDAIIAKANERYVENKGAILAQRAMYRERNGPAIRARANERYAENRPTINAKQAIYREKNRPAIRAKQNKRNAENRPAVNARQNERYAEKRRQKKLEEEAAVVPEGEGLATP